MKAHHQFLLFFSFCQVGPGEVLAHPQVVNRKNKFITEYIIIGGVQDVFIITLCTEVLSYHREFQLSIIHNAAALWLGAAIICILTVIFSGLRVTVDTCRGVNYGRLQKSKCARRRHTRTTACGASFLSVYGTIEVHMQIAVAVNDLSQQMTAAVDDAHLFSLCNQGTG